MTTIELRGRPVTVRTLTIGEIRAWLRELGERPEGQKIDLIGETLYEGLTLRELCLITSLQAVELESYTPEELAPVVGAVLEANPTWAQCRARIAELGGAIRARAGAGSRAPESA